MDRTQKVEEVSRLCDEFRRAKGAVLADYRGLNVAEMSQLRRDARAAGVQVRVVKNRLATIAAKGTPWEGLVAHFKGPTAMFVSFGDPIAPAKVAAEFAKGHEHLAIKGGLLDGRAQSMAEVVASSRLPGRDELRAGLLAALNAVPATFLRVLHQGAAQILNVLAARGRELEKT